MNHTCENLTVGYTYHGGGVHFLQGYEAFATYTESTESFTITRRDEDFDYYSPDDPFPDADCDDFNPDIHPGVVPSCDIPPGQDFNCDGIDDLLQCDSPVIVDPAGDGFRLTDVAHGVLFDLDVDGVRERLPWTTAGSDDAWLVLDRNKNGLIDGGDELFGNFSPQPSSRDPNGFIALGVFDQPVSGGNGNGWLDRDDLIFSRLRLWRDSNHDGISQPAELSPLGDAGISRVSLDYRAAQRRDRWGNWFRYRATVLDEHGRHVGQWAYDVYLAGRQYPR